MKAYRRETETTLAATTNTCLFCVSPFFSLFLLEIQLTPINNKKRRIFRYIEINGNKKRKIQTNKRRHKLVANDVTAAAADDDDDACV